MRLHNALVAAVTGLTLGLSGTAAVAEERNKALAFSVGAFDMVQRSDDGLEARLEYRSDAPWWLKPFGGITATTDAAVHLYVGVYADLVIGEHFYIQPSFAPGAFFEGNGKVLGNILEFRSQLELGYRFRDDSRLGISLNHISNAGLGTSNPGSESLVLTYSVPLKLF